ncbi:MAG: hypothetical protein J3R72DRAFT_491314 [Linnemannia gamsii]|nr:MAG: hypothetical protein J3R72DRAFT_491314 [Linnemannia gamsii]
MTELRKQIVFFLAMDFLIGLLLPIIGCLVCRYIQVNHKILELAEIHALSHGESLNDRNANNVDHVLQNPNIASDQSIVYTRTPLTAHASSPPVVSLYAASSAIEMHAGVSVSGGRAVVVPRNRHISYTPPRQPSAARSSIIIADGQSTSSTGSGMGLGVGSGVASGLAIARHIPLTPGMLLGIPPPRPRSSTYSMSRSRSFAQPHAKPNVQQTELTSSPSSTKPFPSLSSRALTTSVHPSDSPSSNGASSSVSTLLRVPTSAATRPTPPRSTFVTAGCNQYSSSNVTSEEDDNSNSASSSSSTLLHFPASTATRPSHLPPATFVTAGRNQYSSNNIASEEDTTSSEGENNSVDRGQGTTHTIDVGYNSDSSQGHMIIPRDEYHHRIVMPKVRLRPGVASVCPPHFQNLDTKEFVIWPATLFKVRKSIHTRKTPFREASSPRVPIPRRCMTLRDLRLNSTSDNFILSGGTNSNPVHNEVLIPFGNREHPDSRRRIPAARKLDMLTSTSCASDSITTLRHLKVYGCQKQSRLPPSPRRGYSSIQSSPPTRTLSRTTVGASIAKESTIPGRKHARRAWKYQGWCCEVVLSVHGANEERVVPPLPHRMSVEWSWSSVFPSSLREVLGPIHKEIRYGVDGYKNRPPALVGVRIHYPRQA